MCGKARLPKGPRNLDKCKRCGLGGSQGNSSVTGTSNTHLKVFSFVSHCCRQEGKEGVIKPEFERKDLVDSERREEVPAG